VLELRSPQMGASCCKEDNGENPTPPPRSGAPRPVGIGPGGGTVCREVSLKRVKTNKFKLASEYVAHGSMGAASVLDGCPIHEEMGNACLLIIDPQLDFHEGGSLAVPGATKDSERISELLLRQADKIDRVVVTLDTHHAMHIAHGSFWKDAEGKSPAPFTSITRADLDAGKWAPRQAEMKEWVLEYTESLEEGGRFTHLIWPDHCLLGSAGHAVSPALLPALNKWSEQRERSITWVIKGQNNRTEMYSALKAEVPVNDDPATKLNLDLINTLKHHTKVLVCGEAKSHCVNFTLRDLVSAWPAERVADLVLLNDCCSSVTGFEESANQFETDMRAAGVNILTAAEFSS